MCVYLCKWVCKFPWDVEPKSLIACYILLLYNLVSLWVAGTCWMWHGKGKICHSTTKDSSPTLPWSSSLWTGRDSGTRYQRLNNRKHTQILMAQEQCPVTVCAHILHLGIFESKCEDSLLALPNHCQSNVITSPPHSPDEITEFLSIKLFMNNT